MIGGAALHGRHSLLTHEFHLYPLFSSLILSLLLTWFSTSGPFPLLFLEMASPAGRRMILFGEILFRGLLTSEDERAAGLTPSFSLS